MQFQVPQFIETEDKIFGPLTIKQFLYLAVSTVICVFAYFIFALWLWAIIVIVIEGTTAIFNLAKVNGRPMRILATAAFFYVWNPRVYLYHSSFQSGSTLVAPIPTPVPTNKPNASGGGLHSLLDKLTTSKEVIPNRETALPDSGVTKKAIEDKYELIKKITGDEEVARRIDYR